MLRTGRGRRCGCGGLRNNPCRLDRRGCSRTLHRHLEKFSLISHSGITHQCMSRCLAAA